MKRYFCMLANANDAHRRIARIFLIYSRHSFMRVIRVKRVFLSRQIVGDTAP